MAQKTVLLFFSILVFSIFNIQAQDGKSLFISKCQSCHQVFKPGTGPALMNVEQRHKWADHNEMLKWIHNPAAYMASDPYTQGLKAQYGSMMQAFPDLTIKDVDAIVSYINTEVANVSKKPGGPEGEAAPAKTSSNAIIFGIISLILAIIALILMQINSNLKKMSDDVEGIHRPEPVPFYKNKV